MYASKVSLFIKKEGEKELVFSVSIFFSRVYHFLLPLGMFYFHVLYEWSHCKTNHVWIWGRSFSLVDMPSIDTSDVGFSICTFMLVGLAWAPVCLLETSRFLGFVKS